MVFKNKLKIVMVIVGILLLGPVSSFADNDDNIPLHMGLSTVFGALGETVLHHNTNLGTTGRIVYGTIIGTVPGFAKEVIDSTHHDNYFDASSVAYDALAAFIGSVVANYVNNRIQVGIEKRREGAIISIGYRF